MKKKLYRSSRGKVIAGVCTGLGEYFEIDPVLIRALFIIALFSGGIGVTLYFVLVDYYAERRNRFLFPPSHRAFRTF
jgi:phage shock protein C